MITPPGLELTQAILDRCGAGWDMVTPAADRKGHDPALLTGRQRDPRARLRVACPVRRRPDHDCALERRAPRLVGAAEALQRGGRHPAGPVSTAVTG